MSNIYRRRRLVLLSILLIALISSLFNFKPNNTDDTAANSSSYIAESSQTLTKLSLRDSNNQIPSYSRQYFGDGWIKRNGCDTRNLILYRDLKDVAIDNECHVLTGSLMDPYSGLLISFDRSTDPQSVQIDHVVALLDAWFSGAYKMDDNLRREFANDPLELLAVSGKENQAKSGSDASRWLPSNKGYRCIYVSRQIRVKHKYGLSVSKSERDSMNSTLSRC